MQQMILSPIEADCLIEKIAERVAEKLKSDINQTKHSNPEPEFLTLVEAAEILRLKPNTIYSLVHRNEIPYMKTGKKLYFSRADLLAWIKEGRKLTRDEIRENRKELFKK